jgi:hypothetical protein
VTFGELIARALLILGIQTRWVSLASRRGRFDGGSARSGKTSDL